MTGAIIIIGRSPRVSPSNRLFMLPGTSWPSGSSRNLRAVSSWFGLRSSTVVVASAVTVLEDHPVIRNLSAYISTVPASLGTDDNPWVGLEAA